MFPRSAEIVFPFQISQTHYALRALTDDMAVSVALIKSGLDYGDSICYAYNIRILIVI